MKRNGHRCLLAGIDAIEHNRRNPVAYADASAVQTAVTAASIGAMCAAHTGSPPRMRLQQPIGSARELGDQP
jgi:hypothetical protein